MSSFFQREMSACARKCHQCNNISRCSTGWEQSRERSWCSVEGVWGLTGQSRRSCRVGDLLPQREWTVRLSQTAGCVLEPWNEAAASVWNQCPIWVPFILIWTLHRKQIFSSIRYVPVSATIDTAVSIKREWTCQKFTSLWVLGEVVPYDRMRTLWQNATVLQEALYTK